MPIVKRIVCLANSRKLSGRCIAGKEIEAHGPGRWLRPVSAREHEEVSPGERRFQDGGQPEVLDVLDIPLIRPKPNGYQRENWLLDPGYYWARSYQLTWPDLARLVDPEGPLWMVGDHTQTGHNDRITTSYANQLTDSLRLIYLPSLTLSVWAPRAAFGSTKRRVQAHFGHAGSEYRLWVTDPRYESAYLARPDGEYPLGESYVTVSLGEPYKGACYKLVAAIMER